MSQTLSPPKPMSQPKTTDLEDLAVKLCWLIEEYSILKPRCVKPQGKREFETIRLFAGCCVVPLATTHGPHGLVIVSRLVLKVLKPVVTTDDSHLVWNYY
jgi:hypothetical protein